MTLQDENFASVLENINDISVAGSRDLRISTFKAADALGSLVGQGEDGGINPGVPGDSSEGNEFDAPTEPDGEEFEQ